ncbi:MAG: phage major capsid protein [Pseudomonadales bacterium]|jgi:HK97 family phage major capsid protein|nr:phage major capsid protein [Pseudomonadales bacterium]
MSAAENLERLLKEFKETNDQRLSDMEKSLTKTADGLLTERTEKLNEAITKSLDELREQTKSAEKRAEQAELLAKRVHLGKDDEPRVKAADLAEFRAMNKGAEVTAEDYLERKAAMELYLRKGRLDKLEAKAMSVDSDPEGGYYVMPDMSGRTVRLVYETSPVRQVAAQQSISTDALEGFNDLDEAGFGWVGERQARPETTTPDVGKWKIPVHELYAEPRATQKLLDDAMVDIEQWLADKVADRLARAENTAFVSGDGVEKPRGFLTYPSGVPTSSTWNVIERVLSGVNGAFPAAAAGSGDPLINLMFTLKAAYRNGAVWMMNKKTFADVRKLKDSDGNYLWTMGLQESGLGLQLLGQPVIEAEDMPDVANGSLSIAFGNFGVGYQIVDRAGIRVLRDPFTAKPYVKFYTTKRTGGDVINFEAIKLMQFSAP